MHFLENTDLLKIEDILPFFPDFVVIDDFKEEICNALEGYAAHIDELKSEMDDATRNAQAIKSDIAVLKTRFVTIDAGERCSSCGNALLTRQFYVFPCQHTFHADCLIGLVRSRACSFPPICRRLCSFGRRKNTCLHICSGGLLPCKTRWLVAIKEQSIDQTLQPHAMRHPVSQ